jgi:hypothetical protein
MNELHLASSLESRDASPRSASAPLVPCVGADNSVIVDVAVPGAQDTQDVLELAVKMRRPEATKDTE